MDISVRSVFDFILEEYTIMKTNAKTNLRKLVECALFVAIAVAVDLIPFPKWPQGGSVSLCAIPIIYCAYRHGTKWGIASGFLLSCMQMVLKLDLPPAKTFVSIFLCIILDYVLAFTFLGSANLFASLFGKFKIVGYAAGAIIVGILRFACSFLSGIILWSDYAPKGTPVWIYSLTYNGSYMIPNTIISAVAIVLLCLALNPKTLRPYKKSVNS